MADPLGPSKKQLFVLALVIGFAVFAGLKIFGVVSRGAREYLDAADVKADDVGVVIETRKTIRESVEKKNGHIPR